MDVEPCVVQEQGFQAITGRGDNGEVAYVTKFSSNFACFGQGKEGRMM